MAMLPFSGARGEYPTALYSCSKQLGVMVVLQDGSTAAEISVGATKVSGKTGGSSFIKYVVARGFKPPANIVVGWTRSIWSAIKSGRLQLVVRTTESPVTECFQT